MYLDFLKAYKQWIDDGAPCSHPYFHRTAGLCLNFSNYLDVHSTDQHDRFCDALYLRLKLLFGDGQYPFNNGDWHHYLTESNKARCHLNWQRITFVNDEIERLS